MATIIRAPQIFSIAKSGYVLSSSGCDDDEYNILKENRIIGKICVRMSFVTTTIKNITYSLPYKIEVEVVESTEELPKKEVLYQIVKSHIS